MKHNEYWNDVVEKIRQIPGYEKGDFLLPDNDKRLLVRTYNLHRHALQKFGEYSFVEVGKYTKSEWSQYLEIPYDEVRVLCKVRFGKTPSEVRNEAVVLFAKELLGKGQKYERIVERIVEEFGMNEKRVRNILTDSGILNESFVYAVVWWEKYECAEIDSLWDSKELAERRLEVLKSGVRSDGEYFYKIIPIKVNNGRLLSELGFEPPFDGGRSIFGET